MREKIARPVEAPAAVIDNTRRPPAASGTGASQESDAQRKRIKQAVSEIKKVARTDEVLAAERDTELLVEGYDRHEITGLDVQNAYSYTMQAAEHAGCAGETQQRIRDLVTKEASGTS